ncbi:MAG TPA: DUF5715 family protein [Pyrinomonadaceae bacterium]|nr:DUF5715 family protein [Pyrinomonadaceae bacterium]
MRKRILLLFLFCAVACAGVWALVRFTDFRRTRLIQSVTTNSTFMNSSSADAWVRAAEKVKEARTETGGAETPPELKHYSERYWFLATQVAEIDKYNVHTCQDFLDLASMIQRGEVISVPFVTDSYVLFGIGQRADDAEFSRFEDDDESTDPQQSDAHDPQKLARDYEALQALAKNFGGRSYDLYNPSDRQALKINMLSSVRPEAFKILEEVAAAYHRQFDRPLPVSSLMRPEQYQHALRRVNRNAVLIDSPPHSTGLAFDIDYRYMSGPEQTFVMTELARLKREGRIEVIRERNANYHVFAFINGIRPPDDLITAALEKAGAPPPEEAHHAAPKPAKVKEKPKRKSSKKRRR